jgi:apolipoprotein N-acyltransferase
MEKKHLIGMTLWRLPLAILGGLISSLAMPRENFWPLIFVSLALVLISVRGLRFWSGSVIGFFGGFAFYASQIEWMSLYLGPIPWLALSFLEGVIFGIGLGVIAILWSATSSMKQSAFRPILIAAAIATVWTSREWISINLPYGGFPWSRLAQALSDSFLANFVYFVGISGLSFVVAFLTVLAIGWFENKKVFVRENYLSFGAFMVLLLIPAITTVPANAEAGEITIAAVQGNANAGLFSNSERGTFLRNHLEASQLLLTHPMREEIDVIVWPENASDVNPQTDELAALQIDSLTRAFDVPLIFGSITEANGEIYNSSLYWAPGQGQQDQYDKKRPVPFAEYVPDRDFWYQLAPDLIGLVSRGYTFGTRDGIFELNGANLGALICFEIAIDAIGRELVSDGAQIILSQTNNADFGRSDETFQQAALARLRAIETGRTIVNISTVGVSVIYSADGSIVEELPIYTSGVMVQTLPLRTSITPAMFIGDFFDLTINLLALGLLSFAIRFRVKRNSYSHRKVLAS